jgi:hypothetical protein
MTQKTRAQLADNADSPFRTGNDPTNADFQDLADSFFNLLDDIGNIEQAFKNARTAMTAHETFTQATGNLFFKDPGGANRNFDPTGTFVNGTFVFLSNIADADETITFDSGGLTETVMRGEKAIFVYHATDGWTVFFHSANNQAPFNFKASIPGAMTANQTFTAQDGNYFERDPGGANRTFNPSGTFRAGAIVEVVNTADAAETITFDSAGIAAAIAQNQWGRFAFNGATWRKLYVGAFS